MRYNQLMESTGKSVRDLNLLPDFWKSERVRLCDQQLDSLDGCPDEILGSFIFWRNNLTSLSHVPKIVDGSFDCSDNQLTSLQHSPLKVGGYFDCSDNQLTSLAHAPSNVGDSFDCRYNHLTSLANIHTHILQINGELYIGGNPIISHILGILLIRGCTQVSVYNSDIPATDEFRQAVAILNKYLGRGRAGVMDCQAEMIAHGLDDFAQI